MNLETGGTTGSVGSADVPSYDRSRLYRPPLLITMGNSDRSAGVPSHGQPGPERFRKLLDISDVILAIIDRQGTVLYWSPGAERALGVSSEKLRRFERIHPDDALRIRHQLGELSTEPGGVLRTVYRFQHGDGSWRTLQSTITNRFDDPDIGGLVALSEDVTERQKAQEAAQRSEQYYRELIAHLPGAVAVHRADRILFTNRSFSDLTGFSANELLGRSFADLAPPEERELIRERLSAVSPDGKTRSWEGHLVCKNGRLVLKDVTPILFNTDDGPAILTFMRDVTEFKRVQRADHARRPDDLRQHPGRGRGA